MLKSSLVALISLFSYTKANLNQKFSEYLDGSKSIDHESFEMIWNEFESTHGLTSPNSKKPVAHRKNNF